MTVEQRMKIINNQLQTLDTVEQQLEMAIILRQWADDIAKAYNFPIEDAMNLN